VEYDLERDVIAPILEGKKRGKEHNLIVVAEGVGKTVEMAIRVEAITKVETRATILGHIQRGGSPTVTDRLTASRMGLYAVELLSRGVGNRIVAARKEQVIDVDILEGLGAERSVDDSLLEMARILSM
jgi:6-phosphofructokinase 1